jgi:hypothetical protein
LVGIADSASLGIGPLLRSEYGIAGPNQCSSSYKAGQIAGIIGGFLTGEGELNLAFKAEHYASRLIEAGVDVEAAEAAVAADLQALDSIPLGEWIKGQVSVDGQLLNYRAMQWRPGSVSVGTIHVPN